MAGMKLQRAGALSASLAAAVISAAQAAPSGQDILTRAAAAAGLSSYSVPAHFDVKMHRPISMRSGVDGTAYFKAPAKAAIAITHVPGPLGSFFKGSYTLDMLPQTWPSKYVVTSQRSITSPSALPSRTIKPFRHNGLIKTDRRWR